MLKRLLLVTMAALLALAAPPSVSRAQQEFTLEGEWRFTSSPINGETVSRMGNSLGFPVRDMVFTRDGDLFLGQVNREDQGADVKPLGVWRVNGDRFSATFQLWCTNSNFPCGSIIMRGRFISPDEVRGTMTAFFDEKDPGRPTGYDTWPMEMRGQRLAGGAQQ